MSLRKEGASRGATTSFLISTPQTGLDSILATAAILGIPFAIMRPVAALVTGILGGLLVNGLTRREPDESACSVQCASEQTAQEGFGRRVLEALRYGFVDMIQDIGRWLIIGLVIAGLITIFVPDDFFLKYAGTPLASMAVVLAISIPMYVCATGSIPIAAALMLKGITPGAALVLLMAGPASNMASMLVIRKVMGRKTMWIYLLSITLGAIGFGLIIDYLLPVEWFTQSIVQSHACCHEQPAVFKVICSIVLGLLLIYALIKRFTIKKEETMDKREFKVDGMMCNHCRANVENAIKSVEGVTDVTVDLASGIASVQGTASDESIINVITERGYTAKRQ
jgi:hypothetical protein